MTESAIDKRENVGKVEQPWLASGPFDLSLIVAPAFLSSLFVLLFREQLDGYDYLPLWAWVSFVLVVDVAHVYSTLFRTYLDPDAVSKNKNLLIFIPILCWALGALLYSLTKDGLVFWKTLAYLAVFHFIRQQFGFMALYSRKEPEQFRKLRWLDGLAVYIVTLYPLLYWHTHLPRNFNWFIAGDFFTTVPHVVSEASLLLYVAVLAVYVVKEIFCFKNTNYFNLPKNLILIGTAFSWWIGIISLNSDMAFTITNVLTHGIPYMALIWLYHHKPKETELSNSSAKTRGIDIVKLVARFRNFAISSIPVFLLFLVFLAYLEEGFWDGLIWREHLSFFAVFKHLPELTDPSVLAILIPFLALPQSTHYVLDGFIWRIKDKNSIWTT